jgi:F-type H+-transporting ATPase subunit b
MRQPGLIVGLLAALVLLHATPSLRADEKKVVSTYKAEVHEGHEKKKVSFDLEKPADRAALDKHLKEGTLEHLEQDTGTPNPLQFAADLGLWALVVFVLLLVILRKMAWGPMLEGLKKREETIKAAVDEAKLARADTQRVTEEFKGKMAEAYAEIPKLMDEARRDAQRVAEEMRTRAQADIQADRQRLRREIETGKDQALKELQDFAADLATRISTKVLKRALSVEDHRRLVEEALAEMPQSKSA